MLFTELSGHTKVRCDGCGTEIEECGWMPEDVSTPTFRVIDDEIHWCDECFSKQHGRGVEFRICERCGQVMTQGYVIGDACTHVCDECFEPWMDENCPNGWRVNDHEDDRLWEGGYYDELIDGKWRDTGAYWTQWD